MRKLSFPVLDLESYGRSTSDGERGQNAHIKRKAVALQEQPQVRIFAEYRVVGDLLYAFFQCQSSLPHKLIVEPTEGVLVGNRRDDYSWIVI